MQHIPDASELSLTGGKQRSNTGNANHYQKRATEALPIFADRHGEANRSTATIRCPRHNLPAGPAIGIRRRYRRHSSRQTSAGPARSPILGDEEPLRPALPRSLPSE
jgi:hypothetical protein